MDWKDLKDFLRFAFGLGVISAGLMVELGIFVWVMNYLGLVKK